MTVSKVLLVATLAGVAAACGEKQAATIADRTATADSTTVAPIARSTDTLKVQGLWSDSVTAESAYTAEYVNNRLVAVEELMMFPDGMRSSRAYFYDSSFAPTRLFEHRALTAASGNSTPKMLHALLNVFLTGDRVDSARKTVDLVAKTVQPYEIENLRAHERVIFARVAKTYAAP